MNTIILRTLAAVAVLAITVTGCSDTNSSATVRHSAKDSTSIFGAKTVREARLALSMGADVNARHWGQYSLGILDGATPLMFAVANKNYELSKYLLEQGANPKLRNKAGMTPLMLAKESGQKDMIKLLKENE